MTTQMIVAANVRARLAWLRKTNVDAADHIGCSIRAFTGKSAGLYPFKPNELGRLAAFLELSDPGPLYRIPPDFPAAPAELEQGSRELSRSSITSTLPLLVAA